MTSIELKDIRLHGRHGLYEGESKTGNLYHIDLSVKFDERDEHIGSLRQTINYVKLYEILRQRMQTPVGLLETLGSEVVQQIKNEYPKVNEILISIYKLQPPIENFEGRVGITLHKIFE